MARRIPNEAIVASLLQNSTIKSTSEALGISERTIFQRMREKSFRELYESAKADLLRSAVISANNKIGHCLDIAMQIAEDTEINAAVRLQAAQTVLNIVPKFNETLRAAESFAREEEYRNLWEF